MPGTSARIEYDRHVRLDTTCGVVVTSWNLGSSCVSVAGGDSLPRAPLGVLLLSHLFSYDLPQILELNGRHALNGRKNLEKRLANSLVL